MSVRRRGNAATECERGDGGKKAEKGGAEESSGREEWGGGERRRRRFEERSEAEREWEVSVGACPTLFPSGATIRQSTLDWALYRKALKNPTVTQALHRIL